MKKGSSSKVEEDDIPFHVTHQDVFLAKKLASTEKKIRDQALKKLANWLESRDTFTELEMMKVWKGLFYCFWHSDKPMVQMELAERLAGLLFVFKNSVDLSCLFIQTFFITIQREWIGIDRLRLDKYMLFIRFFVRHVIVYLGKENGWDGELTLRVMDILTQHAVGKEVRRNALGLLYHLADIYLTEVGVVLRSKEKQKAAADKKPAAQKGKGKKGGKKEEKEEGGEGERGFELADEITPEVFCLILSPFLDVCASAEERTIAQRVHKNVFLELLVDLEGEVTVPAPEGTPPFFTHFRPERRADLLKGLSDKVFQIAASGESTLDKNRRRMYTYRERLQKEAEKYNVLLSVVEEKKMAVDDDEPSTPPSTRKRKRAEPATDSPANKNTRARQKRLNQELDQAAGSSSSSSSSPSSSSSNSSSSSSASTLADDMDAMEEEIAGRTRAKKRKKSESTAVLSTASKTQSAPVFSTPIVKKEKRKVYFDLGKNKVQEARDAINHHPPIPSPLKRPASPAVRATPKQYPAPPKSPGLSVLRQG